MIIIILFSSESELTSQEQSEEDDEEDEPVEVKVVGKIMQDFKEAGQSIEWNSENINRIVRAHTGSTNLSVDDVKVILHKNLEKFWKFAVRQSAFQVRYLYNIILFNLVEEKNKKILNKIKLFVV